MAETDETIEIPVDEPEIDAAEGAPAPKAAETPPADKIIEPAEGIETLKAQLEAEKAATAEANRRAQEAANREAAAKGEVQDSNLSLVVNAIEMVKQSSDALESQYAEAASAGDWGAAGKIQRAMSENAAKLLQLEAGKAAMEAAPKQQPRQEITDPVERLAAQLTPRSAAWIRRHPNYATDNRLYQRMLAAHNLAITDGLEPDSDDYFGSIEDTLKIGQRRPAQTETTDDDALSGAATATQHRSGSPPAAPVTRSGNGTGNRSTIRLTPEEVEMAEMTGLTREQYAKNKAELMKEGKLTH